MKVEPERARVAAVIALAAIDVIQIIAKTPEAVAAVREILGTTSPALVADDVDRAALRRRRLAKKLGISCSTVDRLTPRDGLPSRRTSATPGDTTCRSVGRGSTRAVDGRRRVRRTDAADVSIDDVIESNGLKQVGP